MLAIGAQSSRGLLTKSSCIINSFKKNKPPQPSALYKPIISGECVGERFKAQNYPAGIAFADQFAAILRPIELFSMARKKSYFQVMFVYHYMVT